VGSALVLAGDRMNYRGMTISCTSGLYFSLLFDGAVLTATFSTPTSAFEIAAMSSLPEHRQPLTVTVKKAFRVTGSNIFLM